MCAATSKVGSSAQTSLFKSQRGCVLSVRSLLATLTQQHVFFILKTTIHQNRRLTAKTRRLPT